MIKVTFNKESSGKYIFKFVQDNIVMFKKEYSLTRKFDSGWKDQATLYTAYVKFIQSKINEELEKNPNFRFKGFHDFKQYIGAKMQHEFFDHESEYMPKK